MSRKTPAVVFHLDMLRPDNPKWKIGDGDLIDYLCREGVFAYKSIFKEGDYMDYTDKEGIFNSDSDGLDAEQISKYRKLERQSKSEGCPKYIGYLSFRNEFLEDNGLLINGHLDKARMMDTARKGINALIQTSQKLKNDNVYWYAGIHEDTDNIHIHFTFLEYHRLEDRRVTYKGQGQDLIEIKAFQKMKSAVANNILAARKTPELTAYKRKNLIPEFASSITASKDMLKLLQILPPKPPHSDWQYNNVKVRPFQNEIDRCVDKIIDSSEKLKNDFIQYTLMLHDADEQYHEVYGDNSEYSEYSHNQLNNFYNRAGNKLLQELGKMKYNLEKGYARESDFLDMETSVSKKEEKEDYQEYLKHLKSNEIMQAQSILLKHSAGNDNFNFALGKLYIEKYADSFHKNMGVKILTEISERNDSPCFDKANYRLGKYYLSEQKLDKAEYHFEKSAAEGNIYAMYQLGKIYLKKDEKEKAAVWLKKSADLYNPYAQCAYGLLCLKSDNREKGLYYLAESASNGNDFASMIVKQNKAEVGKLRSKTRSIRNYNADKVFTKAKNSIHICWSAINRLMNEYDYHIKKLKEEFEYENNLAIDDYAVGYDFSLS